MRLSGTKVGAVNQYRGFGDVLYDKAALRPTLDLNFANNESLVDSVTGKNLVTHTRASSATYVDGDGVIKDAVTNILLRSEEFDTTWYTGNSSVTSNAVVAPSGELAGDKLVATATTGFHNITQVPTLSTSGAYTISFYVKAAEEAVVTLNLRSDTYTNGFNCVFDLTTLATTGQANGTGTFISASITSVNGGWHRISCTGTIPSATAVTQQLILRSSSYTGDGTSGIYLWGAQLEESSTVGEYVKTTSTINSAPRFDHDPATGESLGLLVEEARTNIILRSEEFTNSSWTKSNTTASVDAATAPDGTTTAEKIVETTATSEHNVRQDTTYQSAGSYTFSIFAKAGERSFLQFVATGALGGHRANFDLSSGTLGSVDSQLTASIVEFGNGWYRCIVTGSTSFSYALRAQWNIVTSSTAARVQSYAGDDSSGLYLWGAQVEAGAFPTSYIPTSGSTVTRAADVTEITGNNFGTFNLLQYSEEFDNSYWSKTNAFVVPNFITNPFESNLTVDKLIATAVSGRHYLNRALTSSANSTLSVYAKAAGYNYIEMNGYQDSTNQNRVTVNLTNGTVENNTNSLPVSVSFVGNGWYRIAVTLTNGGSYVTLGISADGTTGDAFTGDETSGIYIWGAQLEESSTATPYVKSDVTWTSRASNATYYDHTGTLRKSSYNLAAWSEQFDNSSWTKLSSTISANSTTAPDGSLTADKIITDNGSNAARVFKYTGSGTGDHTFSVYAKAAEADCAFVALYTGTTYVHLYYDLSNETVVSSTASSYSVQNVGNGWFRLSVTNSTTSPFANISFGLANATLGNSSVYYAGDGSSGMFIWGAQMETGPYAGDYAKTEGSAASSARTSAFLPDGNGNFVSAGELLLEDAATNFVAVGQSLNGTSSSLVDNITTPDGRISRVTKVTFGPAANSLYRFGDTTSGSVDTFYTGSIWMRSVSGTVTVELDVNDGGNTTFNLTETWQRFETTHNRPGNNTYRFFDIAGSNDSIYIWGAQLEEGSYATSYIPTYGATATRAADVSSSSSNTLGNSFYKQSEGTVFSEVKMLSATPDNYSTIFELQKSDNTDRLFVRYPNFAGWEAKGQTNLFLIRSFAQESKVALGFKTNDTSLAANGSSVTDTSVTIDETKNELYVGDNGDGAFGILNGTIKRLTIWPERLPNATLQTITT